MSEALKGKPRSPEVVENIRKALKDPTVKERHREAVSQAQRKRFERPEEREAARRRTLAMIAEGRFKAYGGRPRGNGKPPTEAEAEMTRRLASLGFIPEFILKTGKKSPLPVHYKIDLAHPAEKVAVEIDGSSHSGSRREETDARKDSFLRSIGWRVLRFREPFDYDLATRECANSVTGLAWSTT